MNNFKNITTYAGTSLNGYSGDNGLATNAKINYVEGMSMDTNGNLFFADYFTHVIRKITNSLNIITTVAGNGVQGYSGDGGYATNANLCYPSDVVVDIVGYFYYYYYFHSFNT
jgi:hypothetical protein